MPRVLPGLLGSPRSGQLCCYPISHPFALSTDCATPCSVLSTHFFAQFFLLWIHWLHFIPRARSPSQPGPVQNASSSGTCLWVAACSPLVTEAGSGLHLKWSALHLCGVVLPLLQRPPLCLLYSPPLRSLAQYGQLRWLTQGLRCP